MNRYGPLRAGSASYNPFPRPLWAAMQRDDITITSRFANAESMLDLVKILYSQVICCYTTN